MTRGPYTLSLINNLLRVAEPGPQRLFSKGLHDDSRSQLLIEPDCTALQ